MLTTIKPTKTPRLVFCTPTHASLVNTSSNSNYFRECRYEASLQEERSHADTDRFSSVSTNKIPRAPPKRVDNEKVR